MKRELRAALAAASFLTRVPVPFEVDGADLRGAGIYFPLVGAAVGAVCATSTELAGPEFGLVTASLLTGALHLDALSDIADACGACSREHALEIMHDSRIGAFGASALVLDLIVKRAALTRCSARQIIACAALARAVPVVLAARIPSVRQEGSGARLSEGGGRRASVAAAVAVACALAATGGGGVPLVAAASISGITTGRVMRRWLGGSTGDALGASLELTETILLTIAARR